MRQPEPDRRSFLVGSAVAAGAATPVLARAAGVAAPALALFDPAFPAARAFAEGQAARGALPVALEGDRVRLARRLFGVLRPRSAAAVSGYADLLLLSEAAREHGYRTRLLDRGPGLFIWTAEKA